MRSSLQAAWVALLRAEDRSYGRSTTGNGEWEVNLTRESKDEADVVNTDGITGSEGDTSISSLGVVKENLVLLDPDLLSDYTPANTIAVYLPDWIKVCSSLSLL